MASSSKLRQKKLEKQKKKRKLAAKQYQSAAPASNKPSQFARFPIFECLAPTALFESGLGTIIIARRTSGGDIAVAAFIVDVFCLGVKNSLFTVKSEYDYQHTVKPRLTSTHESAFENIHPSCARKLIEGAVDYARELGFSPHADYQKDKIMFGDIDSVACPEAYTYGHEGKPFYISGPNESPAQRQKIVEQLQQRCGEGQYDFMVGMGG